MPEITTPSTATPTNTAVVETPNDTSTDTDLSADDSGELETDVEPSETTEETPVDAKTEKKVKEEIKKNIKKLKLKVDGKDIEEDFDLDDEASLVRNMQLAKVAQKRMAEHAQFQKQVEAFVEALKEDPEAVLSDPTIGIDLKQLAAKIIEKEIEQAKKSPEQIEKEKLIAELQAEKKKNEDREIERKQQELERLTQQSMQEYDNQINAALEKSNLPKTKYTLKKMVDIMLAGLNEEVPVNISPEEAIVEIKKDMYSDLGEMFKSLPDDQIEQIVGKETLNRVRKAAITKGKTLPKVPDTKVVDTGTTANSKVVQKKTIKDFFGV